MNCQIAQQQIDDYFDAQLHPIRQAQVDQHLSECAECRREYALEREIRAAMHDIDEAPTLRAEFVDQVFAGLKNTAPQHTTRRGMMWGVGGAMAAGLALTIGMNTLFVAEQTSNPVTTPAVAASPSVPVITLGVDQVQALRVAFQSPQAVEEVTLTLVLPPDIELSGYPGEREISWTTALDAGQNVLKLPVVARRAISSGEVIAKIAVAQKEKVFRIHVQAKDAGQANAQDASRIQI